MQPINEDLVLKTKELKIDFESLLATTVYYASGFILDDFNLLKEFITPYNLKAEELTSKLTGASINTNITKLEMHLGNNNKLKI
ncbi:MAG: hypothetical protein PHF21_01480 [Bacilli bacterium]|nr:hypothetical protein [Bacilli bacterium]